MIPQIPSIINSTSQTLDYRQSIVPQVTTKNLAFSITVHSPPCETLPSSEQIPLGMTHDCKAPLCLPPRCMNHSPMFMDKTSLPDDLMHQENFSSLCVQDDPCSFLDIKLNADNCSGPQADSPPPLPPKSGSFRKKDLIDNDSVFGANDSTRRGSSLNLDERLMQGAEPPDLPPKPQDLSRSRKCYSTLIESKSVFQKPKYVRTNSSDPYLNSSNNLQVEAPKLPPRVTETNRSILHTCLLNIAPPRPPPYLNRSCSSNDSSTVTTDKHPLLIDSGVKSEPPSIGKKYGKSLQGTVFSEAINKNIVKVEYFSKIETNFEPRLQHFPVKIENTHHRLSSLMIDSSDIFQNDTLAYDNQGLEASHDFETHESIDNNFEETINPMICENIDNDNETELYNDDEDLLTSINSSRTSSPSRKSRPVSHIARAIEITDMIKFQKALSLRQKAHHVDSSTSNLLENQDEINATSSDDLPKSEAQRLYKSKHIFPHIPKSIKSQLDKFRSPTKSTTGDQHSSTVKVKHRIIILYNEIIQLRFAMFKLVSAPNY